MTDFEDWTIEMCVEWLEDFYNQPDPETDDSFDRAYRSAVKRRLKELLIEFHNTEGGDEVERKIEHITRQLTST